jgi:hypothetical protein
MIGAFKDDPVFLEIAKYGREFREADRPSEAQKRLKFLLDTDHITILEVESGPEFMAVSARIVRYSEDDFAYSIISFHERALGAHSYINGSRRTSNLVEG